MHLPQVRAIMLEAGLTPTHLAEIKALAPPRRIPLSVCASTIVVPWGW